MKKKWQKMLIPFIAILVIFAVLYNSPREGFQNANLAAVGFQFTGPLSAIYNKVMSTEADAPQEAALLKNPVSVIPEFLKTHPALKYSIIQVSTGNIIYDPITEYQNNKTMSPFPKTTNSDEYIIYSNIFNMPITKPQAKQFYPKVLSFDDDPDILPNCGAQDTRNNTEERISGYKKLFSLSPRIDAAKERNFNIVNISGNLEDNLFNRRVSIDSNSKLRDSDFFSYFTQDEQDAANAAGAAAARYTGNSEDFSSLTATQIESYNRAVIAYLKTTKSYADAVLDNEVNTLGMDLIAKLKTVTDANIALFAFIEGITYKSTIYEPCVAFTSGFQNMEGFTVDKSQLYDYRGNKVFPGAPTVAAVAPTPASAPAVAPAVAPPPKDKGLSTTANSLIALGIVAAIGGGVYLFVQNSKAA